MDTHLVSDWWRCRLLRWAHDGSVLSIVKIILSHSLLIMLYEVFRLSERYKRIRKGGQNPSASVRPMVYHTASLGFDACGTQRLEICQAIGSIGVYQQWLDMRNPWNV